MSVARRAIACVVLAASHGVAFAGEKDCTCEDQSGCTRVNDLPVLFAMRDVVHRRLVDLGARPLDRELSRILDEYTPPEGVPYTKARAFYADDRLAELRFEYPVSEFESLLADYSQFDAIAIQSITRGDLHAAGDAIRTWRMADGVEISVVRRADADGVSVSFVSPAVDAELSASLQRQRTAPPDAGAAAPGPRRATSRKPGIFTANRHQGTLDFHSDGPLLPGETDLHRQFCGAQYDFNLRQFRDSGSQGEDDEALFVAFRDDDRVDVKLAVGTNGGRLLRFVDVRPGVATRAAVDGDCRRRATSVTYTPTRSPLCLAVRLEKQSDRAVLDKLIRATGIRVDGADLLTGEGGPVVFSDMEATARDLLVMLGEIHGLEVKELDPKHFEFRRYRPGSDEPPPRP